MATLLLTRRIVGSGSGAVTKPFNPALVFDSHEIFMETTQTGDINFSLATSGNQKNSSITVIVAPNGGVLTVGAEFLVNGAIDTTQVNVLHFYYGNAAAVPRCTVFNTPFVGVAPTQALAAPAISSIVASGSTAATLTFSQPAGVTTRTLQYSTNSAFNPATTTSLGASPATVFGLTAATPYFFRLKVAGTGYLDSAYSAVVTFTTGSAAAAAATDATRFLGYYDSTSVGNTATSWKDTSGNGRDMVGGGIIESTDGKGAKVYQTQATTSASWLIPPLSATAQEYTAYLLVTKTTQINTAQGGFLFDAAAGRLVIGDDCPSGGLNSGGAWSMTNAIPITAAGSPYTLQVWRLKAGAGAAKFETNGVVSSTGTYIPTALQGSIRLGTDNANSNVNQYSFQGLYRLFAIVAGNDSDQQVADMRTYLSTL